MLKIIKRRILSAALALAMVISFMPALTLPARALASYGTNLIQNGNAQANASTPTYWTQSNPLFIPLTESGGLIPPPLSADGGNVFDYYTNGSKGNATLIQTVNISNLSSGISAGIVSVSLSAYARKCMPASNAQIKLELLDSGNNVLSTYTDSAESTNSHNTAWETLSINQSSINTSTASLRVTLVASINTTDAGDYIEFDGINLTLALAAPTVTAISPSSGSTAGGTSVTITGTNFITGATVTIGGAAATNVTVLNSTSITATTPSGTAGAKNVVVTTTGVSGTGTNMFTYVTPSVAPTATTEAATSITSSGATLNGTVNANGSSTTVTFEYGLTNSYGSNATATQSPVSGSSATSVSAAITGLTANTTYHYRVKAVNAGGTTYGSDTTVTTNAAITGTTLSAGDVVILEFNGNGIDGFTFMPLVDLAVGTTINFTDYGWNATTSLLNVYEEGNPPTGGGNVITYTAPSNITAGTLIRQDTNNIGGSAFTACSSWLYNFGNYNYIYALNSLSTGHDGILVFQGSPSNPKFIWGYHTGQWGKGSYADNYWSDLPTNLTNGVNAIYFPDLSSGDITVDDGYYNGPITAADATTWRARVSNLANWTTLATGTAPALLYPGSYTVNATTPAPTVTSISPTSGTTAGGTDVTITGTNFTGATGVTIGGVAATNVTVVSATSITAKTPVGTAGAKNVVVTTPGGTGTGTGLFTYITPAVAPTVTGVSPASGTTAGGTDITITGTNFTGATGVTIGGTAATNVTVVSATSITARTPAGAAGAKNVVVTTPGGTGTGTNLFTYTADTDTWDGTIATGFAEGDGSSGNPYKIATAEQLARMADRVNSDNANYGGKYYILVADLDLDNRQWTPIGYTYSSTYRFFSGTFNGGGHTISNLTIGTSSSRYGVYGNAGLFGFIQGGTVNNLGILNATIYAATGTNAGALVGCMNGLFGGVSSTVANCYATGYVSGGSDESSYAGGLVGTFAYSSLTDSYFAGSVSVGSEGSAGGLLGCAQIAGTISNCYSTASVSANAGTNFPCAGGLIGYAYDSSSDSISLTISKCYSTGNISGIKADYVAGIVGYNDGVSLSGCYYNSSATQSSNGTKLTLKGAGNNTNNANAISSSDMKAAGFVTTLGAGWASDSGSTNQGYPVRSATPAVSSTLYKITYDANGATGGVVPMDTGAYPSSSVILAANTGTLTKTGSTFGGWNTQANGSGTNYNECASYTIGSTVTLFAKWNSSTPAPTVTSISPTSGTTAGGTDITITGTNFTGATGVTIGGTAATNVTVVSATSITARTPAGTAGAKDVVVTTPGGTGTGTNLFTYVAPSATIASANYNASTNLLTVTCTNMTAGDTINASKLTITGQGGGTFTLAGTYTVTATSATSFSITLNSTDEAQVENLLNNNGSSSFGGTAYNLAGATGWNATKSASADTTGNSITVSNANPSAKLDFEAESGSYTGFNTKTMSYAHTVSAATFTIEAETDLVFRGTLWGAPTARNGLESAYFGYNSEETAVTITVENGKKFDLLSLYLSNQYNKPLEYTITTSKGGSYSVTLPENLYTNLISLPNTSGFRGITWFKITPTGTGSFFELDDILIANIVVTTPSPSATTVAASDKTSSGATLNGSVNANGSSTTVTFEYGTTNGYGSTANATPNTVTGSSSTLVSAATTGLTASTTYHYRVKAVNAGGTVYGSDMTFTTPAANTSPTVTANTGITVSEGSSDSVIAKAKLETTDTEQAAAALTYTLTAAPAHGTLKNNGAALNTTTNKTFTQADINSGKITYTHDGSETTSDSFKFTVSDGAGGSITETTFAITVTTVNDAPVISANAGITVAEGSSDSVISQAKLETTDAEQAAASLIYTLTTVPAHGTLKNNGTALNTTTNKNFTQADINSGKITYSHDGSETTSDSFKFTVSDGASGSITETTFSITVTAVNDAPVISADAGITVAEGSSDSAVTKAMLESTDLDQAAVSLVYTLTAAPTYGTLKNNGTALNTTTNKTFTQADINSGKLTYSHDGSETTSDSFKFTVSDGAGGSIAETTFAITVSSVNDAPSITAPASISATEDVSAALTGISFSDADAGSSSVTATLSVASGTLTAISAGGVTVSGSGTGALTLTGSLANLNAFIAANNVTFKTALNADSNVTLTIGINDGGNTGSGGAKTDSETVTILLTPVNDAPVILANSGITVAEGSGDSVLSQAKLETTDPDQAAVSLVYTLTAAPAYGTLKNNGTALNTTTNKTFTQADINSGKLTYSHDGSETTSDSFKFTVSDGASGSVAETTFSINVTAVNDAPVIIAPASISATEDVSAAVTGVSFSDADAGSSSVTATLSVASGTLTATSGGGVTVSGSGTGTITLTGTLANLNAFIAANNVIFKTALNADSNVTLTIGLNDGGNTGSGGAKTDSETVTILVTPVNDSPVVLANSGITVAEGSSDSVIAKARLETTDAEQAASSLTYTLTAIPAYGTLKNNGTALNTTTNKTFTQADINSGKITYTHDGSETTSDSFKFTVSDGAGGTISETTFAIVITAVNDVPTFAGIVTTLTVEKNSAATDIKNLLKVSDPDSSQTLTWSQITAPAHGVLSFTGATAASSGTSITSGGTITYTPATDYWGTDSFTVQVSDGAGGTVTRTISVTVEDTIAPTVVSVSVPTSGIYVAGQNFDFKVKFDENVTVVTGGGISSIALTIGTNTRTASYVSGSGTSELTFRYNVVSGDMDTDGIAVGALSLNGGSIRDGAGNNANLTLNSVGTTTGILVDTTAPTVTSVAVPANGTYVAGQNLDFTVYYDENVTVITTGGTPSIALTIGSTARNAIYISGSGTSALVFRHTVVTGDMDTNGISVGTVSLNGGSIKDAAGNNANLALNNVNSTSSVLVDAINPAVTSVAVPSNGTYVAGQNLDFTVNFDENVTVITTGGTPSIALTIGSTARNAIYISGSGTSALVFRYTVPSGDSDTDGITVGALSLNGGSIKDSAGNNANLTLNSVGSTTAVLVDAVVPSVVSVSVPSSGIYIAGQNFDFKVKFDENVNVVTTGGTPYLAITIGTNTRTASYVSGNGTSELTFRYTVVSGDMDTDGIAVSALSLNGGSIRDGAGNNANLTLNSVATTTGILVDTTAPAVTSVDVPTNSTYIAGQNLEFTVNFDENVTVVTGGGIPSIALTIGTNTRTASYVSGSGTSALVFRYTVLSGDTDTDGIAVGALSLNGGSIKDAAGNIANLTLNSVGTTSGVLVDTTAPTVTSVSVPTSGRYIAGKNLDLKVKYDENIFVVTGGGTPYIAITVGTNSRSASYLSGSGTSELTFRYTVVSGDTDTDGISIGALSLGGGSIKDAAGNNANLALNGLGATTDVLVDTTAPTVTSFIPANGTTGVSRTLSPTFSFGEQIYRDNSQNAMSNSPLGVIKVYKGTSNAGTELTEGVVADNKHFTVSYDSLTSYAFTITFGAKLENGQSYYIEVQAGKYFDLAGNPNSTVQGFVFTTVETAPTITSISPNKGNLGGGNSVIITGTDFTGVTEVKFGPYNARSFTLDSDSQITAVSPANIAGAVDITVTTIFGTSSIVSADVFMYVSSGGGNTTETGGTSDSNVLINGESKTSGTTTTTTSSDGSTTTTTTIDSDKLTALLSSSGNGSTVTVPFSSGSGIKECVLTGKMVDTMQDSNATLEIKTGNVSYSIPASQIDIDSVAAQLGSNVPLSEIKVSIKISEPPASTIAVVENAAGNGNFTIVIPPISFEISCSYNGQKVEVSHFRTYVERRIRIPEGVDPSKITTATVLNADGTVSHIPTQIEVIDGVYYAKVNSLTNSVYTLIWHPVEFPDVSQHWAKSAINDMGSRMVVNGDEKGYYNPDRYITRAEFSAIIVRALGLRLEIGATTFSDVGANTWYSSYIKTALKYGIIKGYDSFTFGPNDKITREQAMTMLSRAMKITELLKTSISSDEISSLISKYPDAALVSEYAKEGAAACIKTGVANGRTDGTLAPKDYVTRAEVAVMAQRLLKKSNLI